MKTETQMSKSQMNSKLDGHDTFHKPAGLAVAVAIRHSSFVIHPAFGFRPSNF